MKLTLLLLPIILLCGCAHVQTSYVQPITGPKASLKIIYRDLSSQRNMHVNYHEKEMCNLETTKFLDLLNAAVAGYPNKKEINVSVPANIQIGISVPQFNLDKLTYAGATLSVCEPLVSFTPLENESYVIEVSPCKAVVHTSSEFIASSETPNNCKVSYENLGNFSNFEEFHLKKN
ncbi:MAG: hypothetical protein EOO53_15235 [Gammaproteobacteria bacterium]|nr:MAG: hypothetical protein EOO53_15235 [Gammaproteobacteria bacterium]